MTGKDRDETETSATHPKGGRLAMEKKLTSPNHLQEMPGTSLRTPDTFSTGYASTSKNLLRGNDESSKIHPRDKHISSLG